MPFPKRTQKQLAAQYKGSLDYFAKPHAFRTAKLIAFVSAALVSVALAFAPHHEMLFSTGPISFNHARFADRCEVCHEGAQPNLLGGAPKPLPGLPESATEKKSAWVNLFSQLGLHKKVNAVAPATSLAELDHACLKCHEPMKLHQPQIQALALAPVRKELSVAEIGSCSMCHREHQGPAKMKDPPSSNCVDCHSNFTQLTNTLVTYQAGGHPPSQNGDTLDFKKDGVRRFIPPRLVPHYPQAFTAFDKGHPLFGYEQPGLVDKAELKFNHSRHLPKTGNGGYDDIGELVKGHKLICEDCHRAGADGVYMLPVTYAEHCDKCHSLHLSTDVPDLKIPHRDPARVHDAVTNAGLNVLFLDYAVNNKGIMDEAGQKAFARDQFAKLGAKGINTTDALMARVFRTGEPPNAKEQVFPACAKCHTVPPAAGNATPKVMPTNTPERWLVRGPFNHKSHLHMACTDCHGQEPPFGVANARKSQKTTDILMPSQLLCAKCHRELEGQAEMVAIQNPIQKVDGSQHNPQLVKDQEEHGGIRADCQYCHPRYHAPAEATVFVKTHQPAPNATTPIAQQ